MTAEPQFIHWAVDDGKAPGTVVDEPSVEFVPWSVLQREIHTKLLPQAARAIPLGSRAEPAPFHGRGNFRIFLMNPKAEVIGRVWFGKDPYRNWGYDGLVRLGNAPTDYEAIVWQVYQRYSEGTYRLLRAYDHPKRGPRKTRIGLA